MVNAIESNKMGDFRHAIANCMAGFCALALLAVWAFPFGAFADANDLNYSFTTNDDNTFADGRLVWPYGGCYALVWITNGYDNVEILANGTLADPSKGTVLKVVARDNTKKSRRAVSYTINAAICEALADKGGTLAVYLLDTRIYGANGATNMATVTDFQVGVVNASKKLAESVAPVPKKLPNGGISPTQITITQTNADSATDVTAVPPDTPQPLITGFEVVDDKAYVTVSNTVPYLVYNLAGSTNLQGQAERERLDKPQTGILGGELEFVGSTQIEGTTNSHTRCFFKVMRH